MGNKTTVTTAMFVQACVAVAVGTLKLAAGITLPAELVAGVNVVVLGLALYFLPEGFPMRRPAAAAMLLALGLGGPACASLDVPNPVAVAETPEQHAFAVYGTFVSVQDLALSVVRDEGVPRSLRREVQRAEGIAKPAADAVLVAAQAVLRARARYEQGTTTADHVQTTLAELERLALKARGPVTELVRAVQAAVGEG